MSKFLVVGDLHCKPDNLEKVSKLFNLVESYNLPVIWLGDQLDTKEIIRGRCLNLLYRYFKQSKLEHYVIIGNHCYFNLDCQDHSQVVLDELPNVTIVDTRVDLEPHNITLLPYIHDLGKVGETLKKIPNNNAVFGHFELTGFDFGNGFICESGSVVKDFNKFRRVVSGHFHKFQSKGNFTYLGTPFSHSFGEANQEKYIATYDSKTDELKLIGTDFPRHISMDLPKNDSKLLDELQNSGDHVRVILTGTEAEAKLVDTQKYHKIKFIQKLKKSENAPANKNAILETSSNQEKFVNWAKQVRGLPQETINMGLEILNKA